MTATTALSATAPATPARAASSTRWIAAGVAAGPVFLLSGALQAATREGFDITRHALSQLATGDLWFLQVGTFLATGALLLAAATGIRRAGTGRWTARLVGLYGIGMIVAGLFPADPADGFPVGTPEGVPASLSWHAQLHGVGFFLAMASWTALTVLTAVRYARRGERGWATLSALTPVAAVLVFALPAFGPLSLRIAEGAALQFAFLGALCVKLVRETAR